MLSLRIQFFLTVSTLFPAIRQHRPLGRRCGWDFLISNLNPLYLSRVEDIQATVLKHLQASTPGIVD